MTLFTAAEYWHIHSLVFRSDYSGYKPEVVEIPNGDGKRDADKRYAHVATKYFTTDDQRAALMPYLERAHELAITAAHAYGVPEEFMPVLDRSALRVLEYPPGAVSNLHVDFDLFTLMLYRDQRDRFVAHETSDSRRDPPALRALRLVNEQAHVGDLCEEIPNMGLATPHEVLPSTTPQHSIVYFAIPSWDAILPSGKTVKAWLNERMARSRTEFKEYD